MVQNSGESVTLACFQPLGIGVESLVAFFYNNSLAGCARFGVVDSE